MNSLTGITVTLEAIATAVIIYYIIYILRNTGKRYYSGKYLLPFLAVLIIGFIGDIVANANAGGESQAAFYFYKAGVSLSFIAFYAAAAFLTLFCVFCISRSKTKQDKTAIPAFDGAFILTALAFALCGIIFILVNQTNYFLFSFDNSGITVRGETFFLVLFPPIAIFLTDTVYLLSSRKKISKKEYLIFFALISIPFLISFLRYFSVNEGLADLLYALSFGCVFETVYVLEKILVPGSILTQRELFGNEGEQINPVKVILNTYDIVFRDITECSFADNSASRLVVSGDEVNRIKLKNNWEEEIEQIIENEIHPDDREKCRKCFHPSQLGKKEGGDYVKCTYRSKQAGEYNWYTTTAHIMKNGSGGNMVIYLTREADREVDEKLKTRGFSDYDGLTDLYNRKKLKQMIAEEYVNLKSCGVLFFDLNYLKKTNDSHGHDVGDILICRAADSIRSITSKRIHAYRIGGDEFVVVVCDCAEGELSMLICLWKARLDQLNATGGIECSVAVGCAWAEGDISVENLIKQADIEMYKHKNMIKAGRE